MTELTRADFADATLNELILSLEKMGFQPHLTTLGGPGVGILVPGGRVSESTDQVAEGEEGEGRVVPKRAGLRECNIDGLHSWAENLGQWTY